MGEPKTPPSVDNHMIGKGVVSIAEFTNGAPGTYNDVGNAPSFEFEMVEQTIEHFSSRSKCGRKTAKTSFRSATR